MYVTKVVWFCVCMHMCTVKVPVLQAVNFVGVTSFAVKLFSPAFGLKGRSKS